MQLYEAYTPPFTWCSGHCCCFMCMHMVANMPCPVRQVISNQHLLLVTLLLCNAFAVEVRCVYLPTSHSCLLPGLDIVWLELHTSLCCLELHTSLCMFARP
jgi:hypothetical protein